MGGPAAGGGVCAGNSWDSMAEAQGAGRPHPRVWPDCATDGFALE